MNIIHYKAGMDGDGKIAMVPVSYDQFQQTMAISQSPPAFGSAMPLANAPVAAPAPPPAPVSKAPPLLLLLTIGGAIGLLVIGTVNSGPSRAELEQQNARLHQENLHLRNQIDQLNHQLMGIYSAP